MIRIVPHKVAQRGRLVHAGIDRVIRLTRRERNRITHARCDIGIAVLARVTPLILWTDRISARRREPHIIRARRQSREVIQTIRIRRRRAQHRRPIRGVQRHRHPDARLTRILDAVMICIVPHKVAQRGRLVHAGIDRVIRLTRRERNRITHARRDIGIAVLARVTLLILPDSWYTVTAAMNPPYPVPAVESMK